MTNDRLDDVYKAASRLFITQGYGPTQVSQVAKEAGIATGSMYNLFSGKKALLHFVLIRTFDPDHSKQEISHPIPEVPMSVLLGYLNQITNALFSEVKEASSFSQLISGIFDYAARYQVAFNIVNWNNQEFPELGDAYDKAISELYTLMEAILLRFIESGHIRPVEYPRLHIRNILENITWWAMHLPYQEHNAPPPEQARGIALDVLNHGYMMNPT